MNSLRDLNGHSRIVLDVTDNRPSGIITDRVVEVVIDQTFSASTSVSIAVGINILEVINYATANVRYRLTVLGSIGTNSLNWTSIPSGLTLTQVSNQYTITGIKTASEWEQIKSPTWTLPSNFNSYPFWYVKAEIIYYDSRLARDVTISYNVYDPNYFYIAALESQATLTANVGKITRTQAAISSQASLRCQFGTVLYSQFNLSASITKFKGTGASLTSTSSLSVPLITSFLKVRYVLASAGSISITLYGVTNATVYWGDATSTTVTADGTYTKSYSSSGNKNLTITGSYTGFKNNSTTLTRVYSFPSSGLTKISGFGTNLLEIPSVLPSSVTDLSSCFARLSGVATDSSNQFNLSTISGWDTSNVTNMSGMFNGNRLFNTSINSWNTGSVTSMSSMFAYSNYNQPLSSWNTSNVTTMSQMFTWLGSSSFGSGAFNQAISGWNTTNVTNMSNMFAGNPVFNQSINTWNVSNVTNMNYMFGQATAFNQPLNSWNTTSVTNMGNMFSETSFNQDISSWNTANVTNMDGMFKSNTVFNQSINSWNTANVIYMSSMFYGTSTFNQSLSSWNTTNVVSMNAMFQNARFNQPIPLWKTSKVTDMINMFNGNTYFDQNLSGWCVTLITSKPSGFDTGTSSGWITAEKPVWGTCP